MSESETLQPALVEVAEAPMAVIAGVVPMAEMAGFFDHAFSTLAPAVAGQGVAIARPAFALYRRPPEDTVDVEVGFPTDRSVGAAGDVRASSLPGGRVARAVHRGGYEELGSAWGRLAPWIEEQGLTRGDVMWEVYLTEPTPDMDPADLRTELTWTLA